ncbi:hypothetical protein PSP6_270221 [Paraburkholderia tropica]|nr:hypothetical protein PSP6_270221 [Paraburkholderia tropica]
MVTVATELGRMPGCVHGCASRVCRAVSLHQSGALAVFSPAAAAGGTTKEVPFLTSIKQYGKKLHEISVGMRSGGVRPRSRRMANFLQRRTSLRGRARTHAFCIGSSADDRRRPSQGDPLRSDNFLQIGQSAGFRFCEL